jgi:pimeloyl-ACP methyl ester carboxylesterase
MTTSPSNNVNVEEITLPCSDGIQLAAQRWTPCSSSNKDDDTSSFTSCRILCLHGFLDNCHSFYRLAPILVSTLKAELVALDFPGHGLSSHKSMDHPPNLVISDIVYYVAEAVRGLDWQEFILIGHSMGAIISIPYAATFPNQVQRLILLDGYGPDTAHYANQPESDTERMRQHILTRFEGNHNIQQLSKPKRVYPNLEAAVQTRLQTARNTPGNQWLSHAAGLEMVQRATTLSVNGRGVQFRHDPRLQWPPLLLHTVEQVDDYWRKIACPTYWLRAEYGWPYSQTLLDRSERLLGDKGTVEYFPGSHHFHADPETADRVAQAIVGYLTQNKKNTS